MGLYDKGGMSLVTSLEYKVMEGTEPAAVSWPGSTHWKRDSAPLQCNTILLEVSVYLCHLGYAIKDCRYE